MVLHQTWTRNGNSFVVDYMYDDAGLPMAFCVSKNGGAYEIYQYETNLQGDVIAVWSKSGEESVYFSYDAWGKKKGCL